MAVIVSSNTTVEDFIEILYRAFQDADMPVHVLDCVERLQGLTDVEDALSEQIEKTEEAERDASDLYEELQTLRNGLGELLEGRDHDRLTELFRTADSALKRHEEYK